MADITHLSSTDWRLLLRRVSRSFDLSIRLLPASVRAPVAVGYLLARASDTVADTTVLPAAERLQLLRELTEAIALPGALPAGFKARLQHFVAEQQHPDEQKLMQALPAALTLLQDLPAADRTDVQQVLTVISSGQQLDLQRFGSGLNSLANREELEDYTWRVAGCVGEFWTRVCARHLPDFATLPEPVLMRLGRRYGQGLQRLNLLRDCAADLAMGRCYWPADELAALELDASRLARALSQGDPQVLHALRDLYERTLDRISAELLEGLHYSQALRNWRLRAASALPALIGLRTVAGLRQRGPQALVQPYKVPRREVRTLLLQLPWAVTTPERLRCLFERAGQEVRPAA